MPERWFKATDGSAIRTKHTASLAIREVEIPGPEKTVKGKMYVICALYPSGQVHHDLSAHGTRDLAVKEIQRLMSMDIE